MQNHYYFFGYPKDCFGRQGFLVKNRFAPKKLSCYGKNALAKSGAGISTLTLTVGNPLHLVMVDRLGRSAGSAVSMVNGSANSIRSASISLAPFGRGKIKLTIGDIMNIWCCFVGICQHHVVPLLNGISCKGSILSNTRSWFCPQRGAA